MEEPKIETVIDSKEAAELSLVDVHIDPAAEKKLLVKLDVFFSIPIALVYLSCFLDRSNIGEQQYTKVLVHG